MIFLLYNNLRTHLKVNLFSVLTKISRVTRDSIGITNALGNREKICALCSQYVSIGVLNIVPEVSDTI
ncbi:hypothetical protein BpHYR1_005848 [Brachionus plicatilis]|uniref:Uncharacterized protein n=1 Tax=Brachionus plicatilis TaxID=10195 RepID=A0A3M7SDH0_BRAPC|nr:hypothetical protein BpHYR1_005848 [Brachionus plicatilis]